MKKSRELDLVDKFDVAHISQLVTLQKKDVKMKKLITQLTLMKKTQKKKKENLKLEMVLRKLDEQRKKVHAAFNQQKNMLDKKKMESLVELKRQKKPMAHTEHLIFELKQQKDFIKSQMAESLRQKQIIQKNEQKSKSSHDKEVSQKAERLEAHKLLVDKSN